MRGPILNHVEKKFTKRDNLGINGVASTISAELCPIVNTITPKPFYWALLVWGYYDYYTNYKEDRKDSLVHKYIKMQNYFFALASVLSGSERIGNFTGADNIKEKTDLNREKFDFDDNYLVTTLSNIAYYISGIFSMNFLVSEDPDTKEKFKYSKLTTLGERLALAFDKVISKTEYYKKYRSRGIGVPREVLIELNSVVDYDLNGFDEVKDILREALFEREISRKINACKDYLLYIKNELKIDNFGYPTMRELLYDTVPNRSFPESLKDQVDGWEIVIGRQYFVIGLEMIWKNMLENLNSLKTFSKWFRDVVKNSVFDGDLNENLEKFIETCNLSFTKREESIYSAMNDKKDHSNSLENGLKIMLSIYNKFNDRTYENEETKAFFIYGTVDNSIPFDQFFKDVEKFKPLPLIDFVEHVMKEYLLKQHLYTASAKLLDGRDNFYIEIVGDECIRREDYGFDFPGNRLIQLSSVMKDLGVFDGK